MKLIEKKYEKVNQRYVGLDAFGAPKFEHDWATKYSVNKDMLAVVIAVIGIVAGVVITSFMAFGSNDAEVMVDTVAVEETVIEQEQEVYGPEWVKQDLYVCNSNAVSSEYIFSDDQFEWSDGNKHDIDWKQLLNDQIVMVWSIDDENMRADFVRDIELFNKYTNADVRVEDEGYIAQEDDFLVPVTVGITNEAWAHMALEFSLMGEFLGMPEYVYIDSAEFVIDPSMLPYWSENHTNTVLHEMGHLYGLGHTHHEDGQQVDSIMSYESDRNVYGYLPGDIAGLKEVFC